MPVPKKRTSKSKNRTRRAHHALKAAGLSFCANCNSAKFPHSVCEACGHYRGKQVIEPKANLGIDSSFEHAEA